MALIILNKPHGKAAILKAANVQTITQQGKVTSPAGWENDNIWPALLPAPIYEEGTKVKVSKIRIHRSLELSLTTLMHVLHAAAPQDYAQLTFSGSFNPRPKRGQANAFSMHSIGFAVDFNSALYGFNPDRVYHVSEMVGWYQTVVNTFHRFGWKWGGDFGDPMHFQGGEGY